MTFNTKVKITEYLMIPGIAWMWIASRIFSMPFTYIVGKAPWEDTSESEVIDRPLKKFWEWRKSKWKN